MNTNNVEAVIKSNENTSKTDNITKNINSSGVIQPKNEALKHIVTKKTSNFKELV